jgi:30S ribosomal protein S31
MGKGDKKSRRGKIILGSFGVRRPRSSKGKGFEKVEKAQVEVVETVKKVSEKPKAEPKVKAKVEEPVAVVETETAETPKKAVKKTVKKAKEE